MEEGKGPTCALFRGIGKVLCWGSIFIQKPGGLVKGTSGWSVVC
jgi:hypothetical protein